VWLAEQLTQFNLERDDNSCGSVDKQSNPFADRLPISRNYRSSLKVFFHGRSEHDEEGVLPAGIVLVFFCE
jgi:hypothetical protein